MKDCLQLDNCEFKFDEDPNINLNICTHQIRFRGDISKV